MHKCNMYTNVKWRFITGCLHNVWKISNAKQRVLGPLEYMYIYFTTLLFLIHLLYLYNVIYNIYIMDYIYFLFLSSQVLFFVSIWQIFMQNSHIKYFAQLFTNELYMNVSLCTYTCTQGQCIIFHCLYCCFSLLGATRTISSPFLPDEARDISIG